MPRKAKTLPPVEVPSVSYDRLAKLTPQEKDALRTWLVSPLWVKYKSIVEGAKPSANCTGAGSHQRDAFSNDRANARLGEIRGWELHTAAMFAVLHEELPPRKEVEECFPDTGMPVTAPRLSSETK